MENKGDSSDSENDMDYVPTSSMCDIAIDMGI